MKLASLSNGHADGRLLIVSRDLARAVEAVAAPTLQAALDDWAVVEPHLREQAAALEAGSISGFELDHSLLMSAMPRSYQFLDASAFLAHNHILADAWGYERRTAQDPPLMYQGLSDRFLPPRGEITFASAEHEIDFEAEFGVITDRVPAGTVPADALAHVRLLVLINDWSLRHFGPGEMRAGFGFLHAKPPSGLSPFAVTPDELRDDWRDGRLHLQLDIDRNRVPFGQPHGGEMTYGFGELVAHAAKTRELCAGTVLGSGTVSNAGATHGSGCIAERRALDHMDRVAATPYLKDGELVSMKVQNQLGESVFGSIEQIVRVRS